jgi:hypothetical protein
MATSLNDFPNEENWSTMDWYSIISDVNCPDTNELDGLTIDNPFPSSITFSDIFDGFNLQNVDLDPLTYTQQLLVSNEAHMVPRSYRKKERKNLLGVKILICFCLFQTPVENETLLNSPFGLNIDLPDEFEDLMLSTDSSSPSTVDLSFSPSLPRKQRTSRAQDTNSDSRQKTLHNAVERRYRDNINAKFLVLAQKMPTVCGDNTKVIMGRKPPKHGTSELYQSKTDILDHAISYIDQLHKEKKVLTAQVASLRMPLRKTRAERRKQKSADKS